MIETTPALRYGFGRNWQRFISHYLDGTRVEIARRNLLENLGLPSLDGLAFLDVGSGSGIHSLAAWRAGAGRVISFDFDQNSVDATRTLRQAAGAPANWSVSQGSVLDRSFLAAFEPVDIVYSWGVLHHTGDQWGALGNLTPLVRPGGFLSVALYGEENYIDPPPAFWLKVKQAYNRAGFLGRIRRELAYVWYIGMQRKLGNLGRLIKEMHGYRQHRGMAYWTDVSDWLGGWPMEFSTIAQVVSFAVERNGLFLTRLRSGEGNTEFVFRRPAPGTSFLALNEHFTTAQRLEDLPQGAEFYLFGTGSASALLLDAMRKAGREPRGVIDPAREGSWNGLPILAERDVGRVSQVPIIVASTYFGDILGRLAAAGCRYIINGFPIVVALKRAAFAAEGPAEQRYRWLV